MTYQQTVDYLYEQLPMFHRVGAPAYKANLDNTHLICEFLKHPENKFKTIHVAGTNGKGSSSHMLAAVFQAAGYKTGLYTSPHLKDFRERIKIDGKMISKNEIVAFVKKYKKEFEHVKPSFFEWTVGLAFDYFSRKKVDIAIIEVGLGGRLDSTNVIIPEISLITNIGFDHMNLLGNTLEKIAFEKAGIIKKNVPVVISQASGTVKEVISKQAKKIKASIYFAEKNVEVKSVKQKGKYKEFVVDSNIYKGKLALDLLGSYQEKNLRGVLNVLELSGEMGFKITGKAIKKGLKHTAKQTGLRGRWETLQEKPRVICDTGHNEDGMKEVLKNLDREKYNTLRMVIGVVGDKDADAMLKKLPKKAIYYFVKPSIPRGMEAQVLTEKAKKFGLNGSDCGTVKKGLKKALKASSPKDLVFIGGSTFVVADAL